MANESCWKVLDANGTAVAYVYYRERALVVMGDVSLTRDQARRVAVNIARLPQLLALRAAAKTAMEG